MHFVPVTFLLFIVVKSSISTLDFDLIQNYFRKKLITTGAVISCYENKIDEVRLQKQLVKLGQTTSLYNLKYRDLVINLDTITTNFGIVVDGDCANVYGFLEESGRNKYYNVRRHWLVVSSNESFIEIFGTVILNVNADLHVAILQLNTVWKIYDVYNQAAEHGGQINITHIGFYDFSHGYQVYIPSSKYSDRRNMTGTYFKSMVVLPDPFEGPLEDYLHSDKNRSVNTFNRFHSRLVYHCRDFYNFSLQVNKTHSWGYLQPDGNFDGMVGALQNKTVDFGQSPIYVKTERITYVDYCRHSWNIRTAFLFRNPKSLSSIEIFLRPLTTSVWISTLFLAVLVVLSMRVVLRLEKKLFNNLRSYAEVSWSFLVLITLGAFCQQGSSKIPHLIGGRIVTISILMLSLMIYQFYSASIVSFLLMKPITTIKSVSDIIKSSLKVGCENVLYVRFYFSETTNPVALELYRKKVLEKSNVSHFYNVKQGIRRVQTENFAFYAETNTAYSLIEKTFTGGEICQLREIELVKFQHAHGVLQKHSPFHDMLDTCYQRLAETGLHHRQLNFWQSRKPACLQNGNAITFNVGIEEMYPTLLIFVIGLSLSLVIFLLEIMIHIRVKAVETKNIEKVPIYPFVN